MQILAGEILIVDDERDLVWSLTHCLRDEGYQVMAAYDGQSALRIIKEHRPDLVILDILMPLLDGLGVSRTLRLDAATSTLPILFLTSRNLVMDRVRGLDSGGDDYLTKPFDLSELKARVRSLLRRARFPAEVPVGGQELQGEQPLAAHRDLELDMETHQVQVCGQTVQLTPTECALLAYLLTHPRQIISGKELARGALGYRPLPEDASLVRWHILNLRRKIEPDPQHPVHILTVRRQGYMLVGHLA